jgi:hypothetical protein
VITNIIIRSMHSGWYLCHDFNRFNPALSGKSKYSLPQYKENMYPYISRRYDLRGTKIWISNRVIRIRVKEQVPRGIDEFRKWQQIRKLANSLARISQRTITLIGIHMHIGIQSAEPCISYNEVNENLVEYVSASCNILSATMGVNVCCDLRVSRLKSVA